MISEELNSRTAAVYTSLVNLSVECCGMSHHHTWKHDGHELPVCANDRPEKLMGCAHGDNLSLRAAVVLIADLGLISVAEKAQLMSFLKATRENLWLIDLDAIDVSTNLRTDVRRQVALNMKADPDLPETIEVALQREQKNVVQSLDLLRQALLSTLASELPNLVPLKNFMNALQKHLQSVQCFEIAHPEFRQDVMAANF